MHVASQESLAHSQPFYSNSQKEEEEDIQIQGQDDEIFRPNSSSYVPRFFSPVVVDF